MFIYARDFQTRDLIEFIIMKSRPIQVTVVILMMGKYISVCPLTVRRVNLFKFTLTTPMLVVASEEGTKALQQKLSPLVMKLGCLG